MRGSGVLLGGWLALGAVPALLAAPRQTTFYAAYADAQDAVRQGRWRDAADDLERAIELRPAPAARVLIYGDNLLTDYYPYSLLARCHLELGEPEAAARWLRDAEARGEPAALLDPLARRLRPRPAPQPATLPPAPDPRPAAPPAPAAPVVKIPTVPPAAKSFPPEPEVSEPSGGPAPESPPVPRRPVRPAGPAPAPPLPQVAPAVGGNPAPAPRMAPVSDSPRPMPPGFWVAVGGGLAALLARIAWIGSRRRSPAVSAPRLPGPDPEQAGPYRLERVLGEGAFATTYLARHRGTGQEVAVKVLHPHCLRDPDRCRRFRQEARLGTQLNHPHLVRLLEAGESPQVRWLAMEYVPGPTLETVLAQRGALPLAEAVALAGDLAGAIAYAHAHGVVHRDLKPANVILGARGAMVLDLGIARDLAEPGTTTTGTFMGTPLYAAPEAQQAERVGPAADWYSLGAMLFEMVAGRPPFQGGSPFAILVQHLSAPVPDLRAFRPVPDALAQVTADLLAKQPDERPGDQDVVAALDGLRERLAGSWLRPPGSADHRCAGEQH